ncbi:MAG: hypothetical protein ABIP03_11290 [Aquihabitans sp.]
MGPTQTVATPPKWGQIRPSFSRQLNYAIHTVVITRARDHQPSRDYIARRVAQGKTPREARRCLKRYIARHIFRLLENPPENA